MSSRSRRRLLLVLLALPLFFVGLGGYDLDVKGEPREGVTAWEVRHSGRIALPLLDGEVLPEKPVLFPWLVALSSFVWGEGTNDTPRFPSAVLAVGVVLAVESLGDILLGEGLLAGAIVATTTLVVALARRGRVDMTLTFFVVLALALFARGHAEQRAGKPPGRGRALAVWGCLALATLTKGPLGAILPLLAAGSCLIARGEARLALAWQPVLGGALYLIGAGWWYVHGLLESGAKFGHRSFLMENVLMFLGREDGGGHVHGPFYLVPYLVLMGLPWSVHLPAALWLRRRDAREHALPLGWLGTTFVFFSIASGKRPDYLLPVLPAVALLVARAFQEARTSEPARRVLLVSSVIPALAAVAALVLLALGRGGVPAGLLRPREALAAGAALDALAARPALAALAALAALGLGVGPLALLGLPGLPLPRRPDAAALATVGGATALTLVAVLGIVPPLQARLSYRRFALDLAREAGDEPLRQLALQDFQILYYLGRRIPTLPPEELARFLEDPRGGLLLTSRAHWESLAPPVRDRLRVVLEARRPEDAPADDRVALRRR